jgi:hypothetical protein
MKRFTREITTDKSREALLADALQSLTTPLARYKYELETQTDVSLTYVRKYRPWAVWVIAIGLFPIGLIALVFVERAYITVTFEEAQTGTVMRVVGEGTSELRDAFEALTM